VGRIERIGDVYDQSADDADIQAAQEEWADIVGVRSIERFGQRLVGLVNEGRISVTELVTLFKKYLRHLPVQGTVYQEFQAVLLASVSRAGVELLQSWPQEELPPTTRHYPMAIPLKTVGRQNRRSL